jgi:hypothetical protein
MPEQAVETKNLEQVVDVQQQSSEKVADTTSKETHAKVEAPKEDLVTRVSKFKSQETPKEEHNVFNLTKEDYEKVQSDPVLSKFYKSMQSDYVKKTQNLSQKEKEIEKIKMESANWTPERIQQLLNDPNFVQSAQKVAQMQNPPNSGLTNEEFSALTDKEKAQLLNMQNEVQQLKMQNWQMQQRQQDEQLQSKYSDYAPDIVDTRISELVSGRYRATKEDIFKSIMHDEHVRNAYELGKQDKALENKNKIESMSYEGFNATPTQDVPKINDKESNNAYFKRLAERRLNEIKGRG